MADAEHAAAKLTEANAQREVQPLGRHLHDLVGIDLVDDDRGERVRRAGGVACEQRQPPSAHRIPRRLSKTAVTCENVVEPFFEQHAQRLPESEEQETGGAGVTEARTTVSE